MPWDSNLFFQRLLHLEQLFGQEIAGAGNSSAFLSRLLTCKLEKASFKNIDTAVVLDTEAIWAELSLAAQELDSVASQIFFSEPSFLFVEVAFVNLLIIHDAQQIHLEEKNQVECENLLQQFHSFDKQLFERVLSFLPLKFLTFSHFCLRTGEQPEHAMLRYALLQLRSNHAHNALSITRFFKSLGIERVSGVSCIDFAELLVELLDAVKLRDSNTQKNVQLLLVLFQLMKLALNSSEDKGFAFETAYDFIVNLPELAYLPFEFLEKLLLECFNLMQICNNNRFLDSFATCVSVLTKEFPSSASSIGIFFPLEEGASQADQLLSCLVDFCLENSSQEASRAIFCSLIETLSKSANWPNGDILANVFDKCKTLLGVVDEKEKVSVLECMSTLSKQSELIFQKFGPIFASHVEKAAETPSILEPLLKIAKTNSHLIRAVVLCLIEKVSEELALQSTSKILANYSDALTELSDSQAPVNYRSTDQILFKKAWFFVTLRFYTCNHWDDSSVALVKALAFLSPFPIDAGGLVSELLQSHPLPGLRLYFASFVSGSQDSKFHVDSIFYYLQVAFTLQVFVDHGKLQSIAWKVILEDAIFFKIVKTVFTKFKMDQFHCCDEVFENYVTSYIEILKLVCGRCSVASDRAFELLSDFFISRFMCCLSRNKQILQFHLPLLSKAEEACTLEWNEEFSSVVNDSFTLEKIDDQLQRKKIYERLLILLRKYIDASLSKFTVIGHCYSILMDPAECVSHSVKMFAFQYLEKIPYSPRKLRHSNDDIAFVIKILACKIEASALVCENSIFDCTPRCFIFHFARLLRDSDYGWLKRLLCSRMLFNSMQVAVRTVQMVSYLVAEDANFFEIFLSLLSITFQRLLHENFGIFSTLPDEYVFHNQLKPGPSCVSVFKECLSSPSLPFIILFDYLETALDRFRLKNHQISVLAKRLCDFFIENREHLSSSPFYRAAIVRISSFICFCDNAFLLTLGNSPVLVLVSAYNTEIVDYRTVDKKSWVVEKSVYTDAMALLSAGKDLSIADKRVLRLLLEFDVYRYELWNSGVNSVEIAPFSLEISLEECKGIFRRCVQKYFSFSLAYNCFCRLKAAGLRLSMHDSLMKSLVSLANSYPDSVDNPELLFLMITSKFISATLTKLTQSWATLSPAKMIYLISKEDPVITEFAVDRLVNNYAPEDVFFYIPQIVQSLRHDQNARVKYLILDLARKSRFFCHLTLWNMKANMATDDAGEESDTILGPIFTVLSKEIVSACSPEDRSFMNREFEFFEKITQISGALRPYIKSSKQEKKAKIDEELKKVVVEEGVYIPSNPDAVVTGIDYSSGRPLQSAAKAPFLATFRVKSVVSSIESWQSAIFKVGDDCRQDVLALQMITMFKSIFDSVGLPLFLFPYRVIATAPGCGVIECIPNAISRGDMGRDHVNCLFEYFKSTFGEEESATFQLARQRFICSLAAYSIVSFLLSFKDRHNGNMMYDSQGHLIHIDFGFMLGISPGNINFEGQGFKLTSEMIKLLGGSADSEHFARYAELVVKGYLAVRPWMNDFCCMVKLMAESRLPCFRGDPSATVAQFKEKFRPDLSDNQARTFMIGIINQSYESVWGMLYDYYQFKTNKIPYN